MVLGLRVLKISVTLILAESLLKLESRKTARRGLAAAIWRMAASGMSFAKQATRSPSLTL